MGSNARVVAALCGLGIGAAAFGQAAVISLVPDTLTVTSPTQVVNVSVVGEFSGFPANPFQSFGSALFVAVVTLSSDSDVEFGSPSLGSAWFSQGYQTQQTFSFGTSVNGLAIAASTVTPVSSLPLATSDGSSVTHELFTLSITNITPGTTVTLGDPGTSAFFQWVPNGDLPAFMDIDFELQPLTFPIPAPSSAVGVGMAALIATRRRRGA